MNDACISKYSHWLALCGNGEEKLNNIDRANREIMSKLATKIQKVILLRIDLSAVNNRQL